MVDLLHLVDKPEGWTSHDVVARMRRVLGERRVEVGPGATVFVPRGTWHGVENTGEALHLVWVVTPPGLEGFFRAIGAAPGEALKQLTPAQLAEIGRQHGTTFQGP